jgi:DNA-binding Lrp family transcriptional regulator
MMLRRAEGITSQRFLSNEIGYSVGKVNYVLKALIDKGLLKGERFLSSEKKQVTVTS